ncbi:hypothetical protein GCM10011613_30940 [Cellvibrio zantedeschiae]|uniref:UPF0311 protein GCM10011613_30940 n=1 Tax=Cellvibrio zantedeschiae TaxID=1237077 RepID=A0ABQ3BAY7_9GAMM|nr:DUF3237 domain-containing protein [Cellvibrio zantedeschiae]GGY83846.1 hypothetical protein GCM10011613_30940 [Cellvibrio zantedeschiae]
MMKKIILCLMIAATANFTFAADKKPADTKDLTAKKEQIFTTKHIWDAKVLIGEGVELGKTKYGTRRMIPITGGTFKGADIEGTVLPTGADFQVTRADGDTEFNARYMLKTNDGVLIQVINRALYSPPSDKKGAPYMRSVLELEAPSDSRYAYLNHAIFLGTLDVPPLKEGEKPYVVIGVHQLL